MNTIQSTFLNLIGALNKTEIQEELDFLQQYQPGQTDNIAAHQLALQVADLGLSDDVTDHFTGRLTSGLEFKGVVGGNYTFSEPPV